MSTLIFINKNGQNAPFPTDDRLFLGEGLFETLRVVHGKPCYAKLHWQRLQYAAASLGIPFDISFELWLKTLLQCIQMTSIQNGGIKVTLGGGSAPRGLTKKASQSRLIFDAFSYIKTSQALKLISASWVRASNNPIYQLKSISYLEAIIARRQAEDVGADDVLFFNEKHHATETSIANVFIIKNNELFTPSLNSGILAGIIRQRLIALSRANAIACFEHELEKKMLVDADAMFVCNALQGIRPVSTLDAIPFSINHPLMNLLQDLLARDSYL
ncbi:aminotransferase class IV [Legionella hackeliae]|uniref:Aminodeoxychorismate lyase n=1 Tax=Legionella hackeliae TaxID=449 RepID=A0A0A8UWE1_LEGHA|nr:aminotransferase class IV [Legionella hackeliae]KTD15218.1 aminodeoxychorismate lyase [Legionella hackeliae]CEK11417.1 putative 4-amino-4-deoxychorismate lyase [Legionella hackeliae]STX48189.1 aminodeoxychorismate lyase [Legionella hackeliae]